MDKLDAVNICLSSMGEPTVNSLNGVAVDAQMASNIISETATSVQSIGWHWNRQIITLTPVAAKKTIELPDSYLRVDAVDKSINVVRRGNRLFDITNNSFTFDNPVECDVIVDLDFKDLPYAAKQYVTMRSARLLQQRLLGNDMLYRFNLQDEQQAWATLLQDEIEISDLNMLRDSWSTQSILQRGWFGRGAY